MVLVLEYANLVKYLLLPCGFILIHLKFLSFFSSRISLLIIFGIIIKAGIDWITQAVLCWNYFQLFFEDHSQLRLGEHTVQGLPWVSLHVDCTQPIELSLQLPPSRFKFIFQCNKYGCRRRVDKDITLSTCGYPFEPQKYENA